MKLSSNFLILFLIKVSLCKSLKKYTHDSESREGDTLIDKILASDKFHELADKIADKAIEKINNQKSATVNLDANGLEIETKKSNINRDPEFKSIRELEKKNFKPEKKTNKTQKRYKPGKINIEAVMQKKIAPSDDLTFRYNRFIKSDKMTTVSDKPLSKQKNAEKASDLNLENENEKSTTKHKVIKKPSANDNSEEQNKSGTGTDEESKSVENDGLGKTTGKDFSVESTKFANSGVTKLENDENPFGNEKVIIWNGKHSDNEDNDDSEDKSEDKDTEKVKKNSPQVTAKINEGKTDAVKNIPHLFRAEKVPTSTPKDTSVNEVDDVDEDLGDDQEDKTTEQGESKNKTKPIIRREGDRTYVLKDSSDYQEYHEQLDKMRKTQA